MVFGRVFLHPFIKSGSETAPQIKPLLNLGPIARTAAKINYGIQHLTRLRCVDNSDIGKQAMISGRPPKCINIYRKERRIRRRAELGDKILVTCMGEMKKAIVVGHYAHKKSVKPLIPVTDSNNIVLLDDSGSPIGTRILVPIPAALRRLRSKNTELSKVLAIATSFV